MKGSAYIQKSQARSSNQRQLAVGTSSRVGAYCRRDLALPILDICHHRRTEGPRCDDLDVRKFESLRFLQMVYLDVEEARNSPVRYSKPHVLVPQNKVFAARALRRDVYTPVLESVNMFQR